MLSFLFCAALGEKPAEVLASRALPAPALRGGGPRLDLQSAELRPFARMPRAGASFLARARELSEEEEAIEWPAEVGVLFALMGSFLTIYGLRTVYQVLKTHAENPSGILTDIEMIEQGGVETEGVVQKKYSYEKRVQTSSGTDGGGSSHVITVHAVDIVYDADTADGKTLRISKTNDSINVPKWQELTEGGPVKVKYLPKDPKQHFVVDGNHDNPFESLSGAGRNICGCCVILLCGIPFSLGGFGVGYLIYQFAPSWTVGLYVGLVVVYCACIEVCARVCKKVENFNAKYGYDGYDVQENPTGPIPQSGGCPPKVPPASVSALVGQAMRN